VDQMVISAYRHSAACSDHHSHERAAHGTGG
jgi:hypothetical protein